MQDNYEWCYQTLEVEADCGWSALRRAYQRQVHAWHPDRYPAEHPAHQEANERIKAINIAFDRLSNHYRRYGRLPPLAAPAPPEAAPISGSADVGDPASTDAATAEATEPGPSWPPVDDLAMRNGAGGMRRVAVLVAVLALAYWLWPVEPGPTVADGAYDAEAGRPVSAAPTGSVPNASGYFSIGSSLSDVHDAQGPPTFIADGVWQYGNSRVYFENGRVTHWEQDPRSPLHAALPGGTQAANQSAPGFTMGSSKAEVLAVQGRPLRASDEEWDYGASKVYFDNGQVSGWKESYLNPLRTRQK